MGTCDKTALSYSNKIFNDFCLLVGWLVCFLVCLFVVLVVFQ